MIRARVSIVVAAMVCLIACHSLAAAERAVRESARNIPVAFDVDVVVVGGSSGAVAAAVEAARSGATVFLAAPRTFLGEDICSTYRFWLDPDDALLSPLARRLFDTSTQSEDRVQASGRTPPTPLHVKRVLDEALLDANVSFLYGCYVTNVLHDAQGKPAGIVMANRTGRQAVKAGAIIDATPRAAVARIAGAQAAPYPAGRYRFTRIVVGGEMPSHDAASVTKMPAPVISNGHPVDACEYALDIEMPDGSFASFAQAEQIARDRTWQPGQLDASEMLFQVPGDHIRAHKPLTGDWSGVERIDLNSCRPAGRERLYVLGACADVPREVARELLRPTVAILLGERIGKAAANEAMSAAPTGEVRVARPDTHANEILQTQVRETLVSILPAQDASLTVVSDECDLPVLGEYDVVVVGGGTGGAPAAIAAARQGARTLVVEYQYGLGGVGTLGLIGRYSSTYTKGFTSQIDQGVIDLGGRSYGPNSQRSLWDSECKMEWYRRQLRQAGADIWLGTLGCGALVQDGTVQGVVVAGPFGRGAVLAKVVIDSTGNADIAAAAGADCVVIDASHIAVQGTGLPPRNLGDNYNNTDYTFVDDSDVLDVWRTFLAAKARFPNAYDLGKLIDSRERRCIVGDCTISPLDFLNHRTWPDTVFLSEALFDTHGFTVHKVFLFPVSFHGRFRCYGPYRSLLPRNLDGILVTGLAISAHRDAMSVYRMQPDIQNQGYAAGVAAALAVQNRCNLRDIDLKTLQKHLVDIGNLPEDVLSFKDSFPLDADAIKPAVRSVAQRDNAGIHTYKGIEVLLAQPADALPLLREAYSESGSDDDRLVYAHVLAMMDDATGIDTLLDAIQSRPWDKGWSFRGLGQWGASLSPVDSLIIAAARTQDKRVLPPVLEKVAQLGPDSALSHHRAVALALEMSGDSLAAAPLASLLEKPGMTGYALTNVGDVPTHLQDEASDRMRERTLRELILARALFRCGDYQGLGEEILRLYARDFQGHYARHARAILARSQQ